MSRFLAIHPGASVSTVDVFSGYVKALKAQGHEVAIYLLDQRIDRARDWLHHNWRKSGKPDPRPTPADALYWAGLPAVDMAHRLNPDYVLVFSGMFFMSHFVGMLRRMGFPVAVLLSESPYDLEHEQQYAKAASVVFTNERTAVAPLRQANPNTFYLPHAYDPELHYPAEPAPDVPKHDVVFVGSFFRERIELLSAVDWTGIDLGLYGATELLGSRSKLRPFVKGGYVPNTDAVELYRAAKIGLNLYRTSKGFGRNAAMIDHAESLNPRAYELAACGVMQVSDYRAEMSDGFGRTALVFHTPGQLKSTIRYALSLSDSERRELAETARQRVQGHTFAARAEQMLEVLRHAGRAAA